MTNEKPNAYTIIEILVALSIAGIIFSAGFVSFRDFSRRQTLFGAGRALMSDLRLAQGYSLIGKKPDDTKCSGLNTLNGYQFFVDGAAGQYIVRASCTAGTVDVKTVALTSDISISAPSPNPILFKSLGEGTNLSSDATIILTQASTNKTVQVKVTPGGEVK